MPIDKYGARWPDDLDALQIEMGCIRAGGKWKNKAGEECGNGLPFHYEQMRRIIWPHLDGEREGQRWHVLTRDEILKNKVTVLLGCGSSGKTHAPSWLYLCEYWCYPNETCVLVSSTDMRGLRLRVWGELSSLWSQGVQNFSYLAGHLIDSRVAITTDDLDIEGGVDDRVVRDMRKGIIGIPTVQGGKFVGLGKFIGIKQKRVRLIADEAQCFPSGTSVDTPTGKRAIEDLQVGDVVVNACGKGIVTQTHARQAYTLVKVKSRDGREIVCTPEHPFFTNQGWITACELNQSHYMVSHHETMQILQSENPKQNLLQSALRREIRHDKSKGQGEVLHDRSSAENLHCCDTSQYRTSGIGGGIPAALLAQSSDEKSTLQAKDDCQPEADWPQAENQGRQRNRSNQGRAIIEAADSKASIECGCENQKAKRVRFSTTLQAGCRDSRSETWRGGGRIESQDDLTPVSRRKKNKITHGAWVDRVEVLQQADFERFGGSAGRITVHNIEVSGHPSYSVNGLLVHNCMGSGFLSAFSNLNKNEDFRAVVLGNPNDILDPLGKAAEPLDGWDTHMAPEKTEVWRTRFMNGTCVNLIGTDSPNFDFPEDQPTRFKYLISKEKIADTLSFFPKDSFEYYSQCVGAMKVGTLARRVLTRRLCEQGGALDSDVFWDGAGRTKVYFVDAAYGGDRAVAGWGEFGKAVGGKIVLLLHEPAIIPISVKEDKEPEQQIAEYVKRECEGLSIPPENMGHDSTGRGSLGTFLARVWSAMTNPVEAGGKPTDRPVSLDLYIFDRKTRQRRLKLCSEHYVKLVTEFWFSVRYTVESGQLRGLTEETMEELCSREWNRVKDDKLEIETKEEMKERIGRSPDLADWCAGIVEMARRKGFVISKLGSVEAPENNRDWLDKIARDAKEMQMRKQLKAA